MANRISREALKAKLDHNNAFVLLDTLPESAYRKGAPAGRHQYLIRRHRGRRDRA
jgi:hypothetical protein